MKKSAIILAALISLPLIAAQNIDDERMTRDLEIAKNILATLIKTESDSYWGSTSVNASYVDGYGVIFTLPANMLFIHRTPSRATTEPFEVNVPSSGIIIDENAEEIEKKLKAMEYQVQELQEQSRKLEEKAKIIEEKVPESEDEARNLERQARVTLRQADDLERKVRDFERKGQQFRIQTFINGEGGLEEINWENIMVTFLADYADLIGQLKPSDKVLIKQEAPFDDIIWVGVNNGLHEIGDKSSRLSVEATKKDISAYKAGKLSLDELKGKMSIKRKAPGEKLPDMEIFSSILRKYYSPELSQTFFTEGSPKYEVLENFGVIMYIKMYSAYMDHGLFSMPALNRQNVNPSERKEAIQTLYPKFKEDIREFVIDYGRTIRSLNEDDMFLLKIEMTRCEDCNIPKSIDVAVKMDNLMQFDQQKLTREKALMTIEIKENFE